MYSVNDEFDTKDFYLEDIAAYHDLFNINAW